MLSLTISLVNTYRVKSRVPRAARSTFSRGGRTPTDIIMAELTTRQSGSSTQNQSIGSLTHNHLIGSSTQKLQNQTSIEKTSIETSKQTRADYVIPIQTLLAFQEQGLVNLPKKTWEYIADEEEEQESLDLIINKALQTNPKTKNNQIQEGTTNTQSHNNQTT